MVSPAANEPNDPRDSDESFCAREVARQVMAMPVAQAVRFLHGFLCLAGEAPEVAGLRAAYVSLSGAASQLDNFGGQLDLGLDGSGKDGQ